MKQGRDNGALASISISAGCNGGRRGAGRPALHDLVDSYPSLDIRDWRWSLELGALRRVGSTAEATFSIRLGPRPDDAVRVTTSSGGACVRHAWFVCPACGARVAKLYLRGEDYRCRRCHGLVYQSQRSSVRARADALETKTVVKLADGNERLPRMHRTTYDRLVATLVLAQTMRTCSLARFFGNAAEAKVLEQSASRVRSAIRAMRHRATRPPPRSEEYVRHLLASLAI